MKCPRCGKIITAAATACRHCGARIAKPCEKVTRRMTANGRIALACGALLAFLGVAAFMAGAYPVGLLLAVIGIAFCVIGKMMA
ncbi:MAG: zinc ribbon domain-containing protein [Pseudomonadota bacterium]